MGGADMARLFVGLPLDDPARRALAEYAESLRQGAPGRYTDPKLYHITLCFLGEWARGRMPRIAQIVDSVPKEPLELALAGAGRFRGGVVWAGLRDSPALIRLQAALSGALAAEGFMAEKGKYVPHITLARQADIRNLPGHPEAVQFRPGAVILYESMRANGVLHYAPRHVSPLPGAG